MYFAMDKRAYSVTGILPFFLTSINPFISGLEIMQIKYVLPYNFIEIFSNSKPFIHGESNPWESADSERDTLNFISVITIMSGVTTIIHEYNFFHRFLVYSISRFNFVMNIYI